MKTKIFVIPIYDLGNIITRKSPRPKLIQIIYIWQHRCPNCSWCRSRPILEMHREFEFVFNLVTIHISRCLDPNPERSSANELGHDLIKCVATNYWWCDWPRLGCELFQLGGYQVITDQAPVPLSIFRSNSKFDENSECSSFEYTRPITTIFCTRHDSDTVVTCAKYRCDRPRIFYTRVFWIFIEFRIRSKYA